MWSIMLKADNSFWLVWTDQVISPFSCHSSRGWSTWSSILGLSHLTTMIKSHLKGPAQGVIKSPLLKNLAPLSCGQRKGLSANCNRPLRRGKNFKPSLLMKLTHPRPTALAALGKLDPPSFAPPCEKGNFPLTEGRKQVKHFLKRLWSLFSVG